MLQLKLPILLMVLLVAVTKGQQNNYNSTQRIEDYINVNRQQYALNIQNFTIQIDQFKQSYNATFDSIIRQMKLLVGSLGETGNKFKTIEDSSPQGKQCVDKYRSSLPTTSDIRKNMTECINLTSIKISNLLAKPLNTSNSLQNYYTNTFESKIVTCSRNYSAPTSNYTECVTKVISDTDEYTHASQKTFTNQMDIARCSENGSIGQALDCSYTTETRTISALAETNILVNKCIDGECKSCDQSANSCPYVDYMFRYQMSYTNPITNNPFYRRYAVKDCLVMKILN